MRSASCRAGSPSELTRDVPARPLDRLFAWLLARRLDRVPVAVEVRGAGCLHTAERPAASVVFPDRLTLARVLAGGSRAFGDAYAAGRVEVRGDLVAFLEALPAARPRRESWRRRLARLRRPAGIALSRRRVRHHYDLGNDFYRLWLDADLVYTCAYFPREGMSLEQAQTAKMEHVCRKLRLGPGESVVEAGCGWGALARYMARRYGVRVTAVNLSEEQVRLARELAAREGLGRRVEFVLDDYRNIRGRYDAFVSVGMLEHVGRSNYRELGRVIDRSLGAEGRGLLHFIGRNHPAPLDPWIRRRIFPGGYPPTLAEAAAGVLEPYDFSILDVENLRRHYAETLRHWLGRFDAAAVDVRRMFDERGGNGAVFERTWRLYLSGSLAAFTTGSLQLFQVVFARPRADVPRTRADLYAGAR
ncbi:MAG TPA: cyclopropane-fatty-acyl-phospholipid synthase family protein [Vicinamibacterales bacterium]|nr:cyclopropane-fatty-acyl-phospholipid synthase family protein [Vicinamibacterales bacterium]